MVGGGVAGMSAACALAEAGFRVQLVERRGYLGGRASSYLHPGVNEVIDNCQHVLFGCCTNLVGFYRRIGVADRIHWTSEMTMIEPGGRRSLLGPELASRAVARAAEAALRSCLFAGRQDRTGPRLHALMRPVPGRFKRIARRMAQAQRADAGRDRALLAAGDRQRAQRGDRLDRSALCGQGDPRTVHELGLCRQHGHEHRAAERTVRGRDPFLEERGGSVHLNTSVEGASGTRELRSGRIRTRTGDAGLRFSGARVAL